MMRHTRVETRCIRLVTFPELKLDHAHMRKGKILINTWRPVEWVYGISIQYGHRLVEFIKTSHISLICIYVLMLSPLLLFHFISSFILFNSFVWGELSFFILSLSLSLSLSNYTLMLYEFAWCLRWLHGILTMWTGFPRTVQISKVCILLGCMRTLY